MNEIIIKKNEMITKKKKKGFTLIELIAVIAILAILGAILVPKISGYSDSAKKAKAISDAKIIVNAAAAYNADHETALIASGANFVTANTGLNILIGTETADVIATQPTEFADEMTLLNLKNMAAGGKDNITISAAGLATFTGTATITE